MRKKILVGVVGAVVGPVLLYAAVSSHLGNMRQVGDLVVDVTGKDGAGKEHSLSGLRGGPVLVFFYPRDDTPGCTKEACAFRDQWEKYTAAGVRVLGVSGGSEAGKRAFADKYELPFPVITDGDLEWARAFGVRVILGIPQRVSFLLDSGGRVAKVYRDIDVGLHADDVLRDARSLTQN